MYFSELCKIWADIRSANGHEEKKNIISNLLTKNRKDAFPILRLTIPQLDKMRTYGLKETFLAKLYILVLGISKDSPDAQSLLQWKNPGQTKLAGDFAQVVFSVLIKRSVVTGTSSLTIEEMNDILDELCQTLEKEERKKIFTRLLNECSALEQMWLTRVILKEMKLGVSEKTVLNIFHPDAYSLYNVCSKLETVCNDLQDLNFRIIEQDVLVFRPFKPMLSKREELNNIVKCMGNQEFWIESKLDGERIQLHYSNKEFRYFSRNAIDSTHLYGKNKSEGSLTPHITDCIYNKVESCILDGEMVAYDPNRESITPFGNLRFVARDHSNNTLKVHPYFVIMDLLFINGVSITSQSLEKRRSLLRKIITDKKGVMTVISHSIASTMEEVAAAIDLAIDNREEGIVVKNPQSCYQFDVRGNDWVKFKPEYIDHLSDDLDLVIVGGSFGKNTRRTGFISKFLCALRETDEQQRTKFITFCRVGTGFSDDELETINSITAGKWEAFDPQNIPDWIIMRGTSAERPDFLIQPSNSLVVQIKACEITPSKIFGGPFTLRFPRFVTIRDDKDIEDSTTVTEMESIRKAGSGKLHLKRIADTQLESSKQKIRKSHVKIESRGLLPTFVGVEAQHVQKLSSLFLDLEFCVLHGSPGKDKRTIEKLILEHGGSCVQSPLSSTYCVISDTANITRVQNIIRKGIFNILKSGWIFECIEKNSRMEWHPKYIVYVTDQMRQTIEDRFDSFGDSYFNEISSKELKELFNRMDQPTTLVDKCHKDIVYRKNIIHSIYQHYDSIMGPAPLFSHCIVYIHFNCHEKQKHQQSNARLEFCGILLKFHGAILQDSPNRSTTHLIIDEKSFGASECSTVTKLFSDAKSPHALVVDRKWVEESVRIGTRQKEHPIFTTKVKLENTEH